MTGKAYLVALVMAVLSGLAPVELLGLGTVEVEVAGRLAGPEKNGRKEDKFNYTARQDMDSKTHAQL